MISVYGYRWLGKVTFKCRGYQRVGENITKGVPDMHEAIDVGVTNSYFMFYHFIYIALLLQGASGTF